MNRLSLEEIKKIELNILLSFKQFCEEHDLRYYLAGGTLLGAIRHRGFIPWDDDIDVCMPRKDYEIFIKEFDKFHDYYKLKNLSKGNFTAPFSKIVDLRTIIINKYNISDIDTNLWIDVFPVDGLPNDIDEIADIYKKCDFYRKILMLNDAVLGEGKTTTRKYLKFILKPIALLFGKDRCVKNIENLAAKYPYEKSRYVGIITWGLYGIGERMPKCEFEKGVLVDFEGYKFRAFSCWDSYLKGLYGNYMQLPPIEKRVTHEMVAYII